MHWSYVILALTYVGHDVDKYLFRIPLWFRYVSYPSGRVTIDIPSHYNAVIMTTVASQITSLTVVYSTVYSDADQRKHQRSASLAFVRGIHRDRWIPRTKGQLRGKCFHLMTSSCITENERGLAGDNASLPGPIWRRSFRWEIHKHLHQ